LASFLTLTPGVAAKQPRIVIAGAGLAGMVAGRPGTNNPTKKAQRQA